MLTTDIHAVRRLLGELEENRRTLSCVKQAEIFGVTMHLPDVVDRYSVAFSKPNTSSHTPFRMEDVREAMIRTIEARNHELLNSLAEKGILVTEPQSK